MCGENSGVSMSSKQNEVWIAGCDTFKLLKTLPKGIQRRVDLDENKNVQALIILLPESSHRHYPRCIRWFEEQDILWVIDGA